MKQQVLHIKRSTKMSFAMSENVKKHFALHIAFLVTDVGQSSLAPSSRFFLSHTSSSVAMGIPIIF